MDTRESLTVRTVTALQRLADLEHRGRSLDGPKAAVLKTALRELETALEELRVASEQLNAMVDEMAEARLDAEKIEAEFSEFREMLPVPALLTDGDGKILQANRAAGDLLNVAPRHLVGKPLPLYIVDRDRFFSMLNGTRVIGELTRGELGIRPRERKPRRVTAHIGPLRDTGELCWFLQEAAAPAGVAETT